MGKVLQESTASDQSGALIQRTEHGTGKKSALSRIRTKIAPRRHGETGNLFSEVYLFSRRRWVGLFTRSGWSVEAVLPNGIFYTGQKVLADSLDIETRKGLSRVLGSSCILYVLRKAKR